MKYIRTKEGKIFNINEIYIPYQIIGNLLDFNSQGRFEILKQADTIEELCDEWVSIPLFDLDVEIAGLPIHIRKGTHYYFDIKDIEKIKASVSIKTSEFYGAIWTDKGLIYATKMNEKGEFELL